MTSPSRCRVAIIGAGYTATEHARAFRDLPNVDLVAIHSRTSARAEKLAGEYNIPAVCMSVAEIYDRFQPDLVIVTVSELETRAVTGACFDFPWTLLVEKPVGHCLSDAEAIAEAAREKQRRVLVALNRRFLSSTLRARADLASVPGPRFIKVQDQENQRQAIEMGKPPEVVANWMFANAIHTIDYFRVFARGPVTQVTPILPWDPARPGVVVARIDFATGDTGLYEGIWHGPGPWAVSVTVPGHRWEMRPLEQLQTQALGSRPVHIEPDALDTAFKPGFRLQAAHACAAALGAPSDSVTLEDSLETMRLVAAIFGTWG